MHKQTKAMTTVKKGESLSWEPIKPHPGLYHREVVNAQEADALGVRVSSVLWEKIEVGGAVLPHYHTVAEIIHITSGKVRLYCNGEWSSHQAGDTFHVPAGAVHSVANDDVKATEQISLFLPMEEKVPSNVFFDTILVESHSADTT